MSDVTFELYSNELIKIVYAHMRDYGVPDEVLLQVGRLILGDKLTYTDRNVFNIEVEQGSPVRCTVENVLSGWNPDTVEEVLSLWNSDQE